MIYSADKKDFIFWTACIAGILIAVFCMGIVMGAYLSDKFHNERKIEEIKQERKLPDMQQGRSRA